MSFDAAGLTQSRWERNTYLCSAVLLVYEYFLQLDSEVEYFWERRWTPAKALFLWSRYYGLIFNISNAAVYIQKQPSFDVTVRIFLPITSQFNPDMAMTTGFRFFHWQNVGASVQIITTQMILELRIWAMYGNSWRMFIVLFLLIAGEATAMGIIFGIPRTDLIATNHPLNGVYICADGDPTDGKHWETYFWFASLVVDFILFCLALWKAWEHRSNPQNRLMREVVIQSALYFLAIFWIYIANMIIWFVNRVTLNELATAFSFVIPSIFANRLLISCRRNNEPERSSISISSLWRYKRQHQDTLENVELTTCNDIGSRSIP